MRLFIGVELDEAVRAAAATAALELKARLDRHAPGFTARWIDRANLHITLWFIGEVADERLVQISDALRRPFDVAPFSLALTGCRAFPPSGAPRVLWIGTTKGTEAMRELYDRIEDRLVPLGFAAERRPYTPHLTIARVKDPGRASGRVIRDAIAEVPASCGESAVNAVTLFRSRLSPRGAAYEPLLRVPLM
jgi:RNA 2',3'-cyclic 3'-phosphodiesterase